MKRTCRAYANRVERVNIHNTLRAPPLHPLTFYSLHNRQDGRMKALRARLNEGSTNCFFSIYL